VPLFLVQLGISILLPKNAQFFFYFLVVFPLFVALMSIPLDWYENGSSVRN